MYYIKYLDMLRALLCSSSGGQNCISTASGIVTVYERPCSAPVESGLIHYRIKELCIKLIIKTSLYYDARSEKHHIVKFVTIADDRPNRWIRCLYDHCCTNMSPVTDMGSLRIIYLCLFFFCKLYEVCALC
jgi:hypothetical protein